MAEFDPFAPGKSTKDCTDRAVWGTKSTLYSYIAKANADEDNYPPDACTPYYHGNGQIDNLQANTSISGTSGGGKGSLTINANTVNANSFSSQSKLFDIPHPTKENKRLLHGCLEGPELGVYVRGWLEGDRTIILPEYWPDLVDMNSITVQLTQIGSSQDLIVEKIDGLNIILKSGTGTAIRCYYTVTATRKDVQQLQIEQDA